MDQTTEHKLIYYPPLKKSNVVSRLAQKSI